ncbi:MAG: cytochrome P450 [Solirubrobacteraceae bacterium]
MSTRASFPLGASVTLEALDRDPHPLLDRLREREPVSFVPALDGWLVTSHHLALEVMRDPAGFTVDDPRFSTARVIGPSMLSLDGDPHARHRASFVAPFRAAAVRARFDAAVASEVARLLDSLEPGGGELRRSFAGPLSASIITRALGLEADEVVAVLAWYEAIVGAVTELTAGNPVTSEGEQAFSALRGRLGAVIDRGERASLLATATGTATATATAADAMLTREQTISNAAVLLFGGIETTEGMIANAILHLLERPDHLERVRIDAELLDVAIEESLRLEPAAAMIDRYATADLQLGGAKIRRGELVRVSISAANRDPAVFPNPAALDLSAANGRRHLAFARGPHVCLGVHLARLETRTALASLLDRCPRLRLDPDRPSAVRGLVFRKPPALHVLWS